MMDSKSSFIGLMKIAAPSAYIDVLHLAMAKGIGEGHLGVLPYPTGIAAGP
jgi:hypothetical protein